VFARCIANAFPPPPALGRDAPAGALRDALFPWLEPGLAPTSATKFAAFLESSMVRERLDALSVRYVVLLSGKYATTKETYAMFPVGGFWGVIQERKDFGITAAIWDINSQTIAGTGQGAWSRTLGMVGVLLPVPYYFSTESQACDEIVNSVRTAITSPQRIDPRKIDPLATEATAQPATSGQSKHQWCSVEGAGPDNRVWLTEEDCLRTTQAGTKGLGTDPWCLVDAQAGRPLCFFTSYEACSQAKITAQYRCISRE
jgi:hypothetical protein